MTSIYMYIYLISTIIIIIELYGVSSFHIPIPSGCFTLKEVRRITWEVRSEWRNLGSQLGVDAGTLDVSGIYQHAGCFSIKFLVTLLARFL